MTIEDTSAIAPAIPSQGTILVVDDTPANLILMVKMLTPAGYQVLVAESGELALTAVAENLPDLILLDIRMKGMNGLEVCRRLKAREETQHIPIILLSAFAEVEEWVEGLQLGAVDYITKPFHLKLLQARVATQVALSRANVSLAQQAAALRQANTQLQAEITERKREEENLRRMATVVRDSNDAITIQDFAGRITAWNHGAELMYGYSEAEALMTNIERLTAPGKVAEQKEFTRRLLAGETITAFETQRVTKDGRILDVWLTVTKLLDEAGKPVGIASTERDITDHKQAEQAQIIQLRIANIFNTVHDDAMFNEVLKVNLDVLHSLFGVFGYLNEAGALVVPTMSRQIWDKCQVPDKTIVFPRATWGDSSWPRAVREKQANYSNEVSNKTPEGHVAVQRHISVPILFDGEVIGLFQVANKATDYTPADLGTLENIARQVAPLLNARLLREQAQMALKKLTTELEQRVGERTAQLKAANKELEAFSYSVSHDLRAPLRHVQGYVDMLGREAKGQFSDQGRRYMKTITDASREMGVLIDDLLAFSRMGRTDMIETRVNLDSLVQDALHDLESVTRERNIVWKIPALPAVLADPAMLKQVFANLLGNAVKFTRTRNPAEVEIGCGGMEGERMIVFIRDNGVGFEPQYTHKLFGVFQRLHRADEFEGTGIGLANVRRIIARQGGRTWAEGTLDRGATFYFTLKPSPSTNSVN
jgi:PAS domain S-box-containing protein